ncbi:MAG: hypothetical protein ACK5MD_01015 [Flavobacteriales bacterium]
MSIKRRPISGLQEGDILKTEKQHFSEALKHEIIQDYLSSGCSKPSYMEEISFQSK